MHTPKKIFNTLFCKKFLSKTLAPCRCVCKMHSTEGEKMMYQHATRKEGIEMGAPSVIGKCIADLEERGITRDQLAAMLEMDPTSVSNLKGGRGSLDDGKLKRLAMLHGQYTPDQLIAVKWTEWMQRKKGVSLTAIQSACKLLTT